MTVLRFPEIAGFVRQFFLKTTGRQKCDLRKWSGLIFSSDEVLSIFSINHTSVEPHEHNYLELAYVVHGNAVHTIGNKSYNIGCGQYFFVDYHTVHSYKSLSGTIEVINCRFKPQFLDNSFESCRSFRTLLNHYLLKVRVENLRMNPSGVMFFDDDGSIGAYMQKMRTEYENKLPGYLEMMRCTLIEIILSTMRRISDTGFDSDAIQFLADYAAKNYASPQPLSVLSKQLGYSMPYLSGRFKAETGMGFKEYLIKIRMDEACRLLANTNKKISDISADVGYSDTNFFYATFRRVVGQSPGEFRHHTAK